MPELPRRPVVESIADVADGVMLELSIVPNLWWFQGHFGDFPILPGIVQIDWALEFARKHLDLAAHAMPDLQAKFKSAIFPGDRIVLSLTWRADKGRLSFEYRRGDLVCSSGHLLVAR